MTYIQQVCNLYFEIIAFAGCYEMTESHSLSLILYWQDYTFWILKKTTELNSFHNLYTEINLFFDISIRGFFFRMGPLKCMCSVCHELTHLEHRKKLLFESPESAAEVKWRMITSLQACLKIWKDAGRHQRLSLWRCSGKRKQWAISALSLMMQTLQGPARTQVLALYSLTFLLICQHQPVCSSCCITICLWIKLYLNWQQRTYLPQCIIMK